MINFQPEGVTAEFERNWLDWCAGGPKEGGWTRSGSALDLPAPRLGGCRLVSLGVEEILAKNRDEVGRWHLAFLDDPSDPERSAYYNEYLLPRHGPRSPALARHFLGLAADVAAHGVRQPAWAADVTALGLGFGYFRFDGCHRACAAARAGLAEVPCLVFKTSARA